MKSREFIVELFTNPLPYSWVTKNGLAWTGQFEIPASNLTVMVYFEFYEKLNTVALNFKVNGQTEMTGTGHAIEIFATVNKMLKEYVEANQPDRIIFSADANEKSRVSLYKRLAAMIEREYGYDLTSKQARFVVFSLTKK